MYNCAVHSVLLSERSVVHDHKNMQHCLDELMGSVHLSKEGSRRF